MISARALGGPCRLGLAALLTAAALALPDPPATAAEHPVLSTVGDVTRCDSTVDDATAALAAEVDGPIALLGDLVEGKRPNEYQDCFAGSAWGPLQPRIRAVPGDNGEYGRGYRPNNKGNRNEKFAGAIDCDVTRPCQLDDFYNFFPASAVGIPERPYYSYDVGTWHIVALDVNCSDDPEEGCNGPKAAAMVEWLRQDLAAANARCSAVSMHHNFIDIPGNKTAASMRAIMEVLYQHGVDVAVSGHRHTYRRYAPVDINGAEDRGNGIRQFVVGTGGHARNPGTQPAFHDPHADKGDVLEESNGETWGVLRLTLKPGGYDFNFAPAVVAGSSDFRDSGSASCHGPGADRPLTAAPTPPAVPTPPAGPVGRSGYWMLTASGEVYGFGDAEVSGSAPMAGGSAVDVERSPSGGGYWVVDATGRVFAFGDAAELGGLPGGTLAAGERVTSLSSTPSGAGYWLFTSRGRVVAFGEAAHLGDMTGTALNGAVLDSIPTRSGRGYYMVGSDGGIFSFGDAAFHGSMGATRLNAPVQSLVPDPDGVGYWLVASDGGIFAFDAPFRGSMGDRKLNKPVTGMVAFGNGYLMVAEDGGIFNFSDRDFHGSLGNRPPSHPVTAVTAIDH